MFGVVLGSYGELAIFDLLGCCNTAFWGFCLGLGLGLYLTILLNTLDFGFWLVSVFCGFLLGFLLCLWFVWIVGFRDLWVLDFSTFWFVASRFCF